MLLLSFSQALSTTGAATNCRHLSSGFRFAGFLFSFGGYFLRCRLMSGSVRTLTSRQEDTQCRPKTSRAATGKLNSMLLLVFDNNHAMSEVTNNILPHCIRMPSNMTCCGCAEITVDGSGSVAVGPALGDTVCLCMADIEFPTVFQPAYKFSRQGQNNFADICRGRRADPISSCEWPTTSYQFRTLAQ